MWASVLCIEKNRNHFRSSKIANIKFCECSLLFNFFSRKFASTTKHHSLLSSPRSKAFKNYVKWPKNVNVFVPDSWTFSSNSTKNNHFSKKTNLELKNCQKIFLIKLQSHTMWQPSDRNFVLQDGLVVLLERNNVLFELSFVLTCKGVNKYFWKLRFWQ